MVPSHGPRESGLDLVLLGVIIVGLGVYADLFVGSSNATLSLVRLFQALPDTTYPAVLPQDRALLLLTGPQTAEAATSSVEASGGVGAVLFGGGIVIVALGVLLSRST